MQLFLYLLLFFGMWTCTQSTTLSQLTASLAPGQSTLSLGDTWTGGGQPTGDDLNWIMKFHYDPVRQEAFTVTKRQNCNTCMEHAWYDEIANQWISENSGFNAAGHAFDCVAYDHEEGAGYLVPGGGQDDVLWKSTWTRGQPLSQPVIASSHAQGQIDELMYPTKDNFASGSIAEDWHPNLFGPGDGGMVVICQKGIAGWRKSTDTWHAIVPRGNFSIGPDHPGCVYSRGLDAVIASPNKDGNKLFKIDDYQTWISSDEPGLDPAPIDFGFDHGGHSIAAIVDDPLERPTLYALEKAGSDRVWKYNNGSWDLQSFKHPFTATDNSGENWMVAGPVWARLHLGAGADQRPSPKPDLAAQ